MGVRIPEGYGQLSLRWSLAGDAEWMVCTWGVLDVSGSFNPQVAANDAATAWDASTLTTAGNMSTGWSAGTLISTWMTEDGPITFEGGTAVGGTASATTLPNNCAVLVRKQSGLGGRKNRGRLFLPPAYLPESTVNQVGTIDPAQVTLIQGYVNSLHTELSSRDLVSVILHDGPEAPTTILNHIVQPKLATQRTRMRK